MLMSKCHGGGHISPPPKPKHSEKNKREHDCILFTLCFSQGCFLPGKQSADALNCLLTWAFSTTEGIGWAGLETVGGADKFTLRRMR